MGADEDMTVTIGSYTMKLERGFIWDRITVYKDVWPALGGLILNEKVRCKNGKSDEVFERVVRVMENLARSL